MVEGHTNWTTMFIQILFLICSVCNTHGVASTGSPSCASDEYRVGQFCCLACPGGYRVHRDCTATTITLCSKCPDGTFKEVLSGQKQCSACTECGTGQKVKKSCTPTSDAECEILDGFFCSESADKVTFSEAKLSCQPHTICDSVRGVQIQPGTDSTDSTCITYVAIVFIIIGCICFIISLVLGALFYRWRKRERELTELKKQIDQMETQEQLSKCDALWDQLEEKKRTPKQERKFDELTDQFNEKKESLELDWNLTEYANLMDTMETQDQGRECYDMCRQLLRKKRTQEQRRKLKELTGQIKEKMETMDLDGVFNERDYRRCLEKTQIHNEKLKEWIDDVLEGIPEQEGEFYELANQIRKMEMVKEEQDGEFYKLIDRLLEKMVKQEQDGEFYNGAAGEGTSGPSSTPLLSTELPAGLETSIPPAPSSETQPAGLETSIPPAPSSETQPAEETTPLMSS